MDNVSQYQFELLDVAKLLIKKEGIKDGLWTLGVQFNVAVLNAGPDVSKVYPSALVAIEKLVLTRATEHSPLTVDAAVIS